MPLQSGTNSETLTGFKCYKLTVQKQLRGFLVVQWTHTVYLCTVSL